MTREENDRNWDSYFISGTNVLKNKLGITDYDMLRQKEVEITANKLINLYLNPINMGFGIEHLKAIHRYLFEDIYPFAGEYRNVFMEKNHSYFSLVEEIDVRLRATFQLMEENIKNVETEYSFACFLAEYYAVLLNIHPFREGNGRTIREFIREYANEKSRELPFGEINFSWSNVDGEAIQSIIDKSIAFRSIIELEFMKAFEKKKNDSYTL